MCPTDMVSLKKKTNGSRGKQLAWLCPKVKKHLPTSTSNRAFWPIGELFAHLYFIQSQWKDTNRFHLTLCHKSLSVLIFTVKSNALMSRCSWMAMEGRITVTQSKYSLICFKWKSFRALEQFLQYFSKICWLHGVEPEPGPGQGCLKA